MISLPASPEIDLALFQISPCVDFVKFSSAFMDFGLPGARLKRNYDPVKSQHVFTLHDPRPEEIASIMNLSPDAKLEAIEVSLDFLPKRGQFVSASESSDRLEEIRQWLITHLYPWDAPGIQVASRASKAPKHVATLLSQEVERRPFPHETLYFGHRDSKYALSGHTNFAFMRLYRKVSDNGKTLLLRKRCCRVEVNLSQEGCAHFGLLRPSDLFDFNFRSLGSYFRLIKPITKPYVLRNLRQSLPKMADLLEKTQMRFLSDRLASVGAYAAGFDRASFVTSDRLAKANDRAQQALKSLTRSWRRYQTIPTKPGQSTSGILDTTPDNQGV